MTTTGPALEHRTEVLRDEPLTPENALRDMIVILSDKPLTAEVPAWAGPAIDPKLREAGGPEPPAEPTHEIADGPAEEPIEGLKGVAAVPMAQDLADSTEEEIPTTTREVEDPVSGSQEERLPATFASPDPMGDAIE